MSFARIFQPAKSAMQSGRANRPGWVLQFETDFKHPTEPLMGWRTCFDTQEQVVLNFDTKEEAIAYAEQRAIPYQVIESHPRRYRKQAYSDNFRFDRPEPWTH